MRSILVNVEDCRRGNNGDRSRWFRNSNLAVAMAVVMALKQKGFINMKLNFETIKASTYECPNLNSDTDFNILKDGEVYTSLKRITDYVFCSYSTTEDCVNDIVNALNACSTEKFKLSIEFENEEEISLFLETLDIRHSILARIYNCAYTKGKMNNE
jgi:hypothetical protein